MRPTLTALIRSVLLTEARNTAETFLTYTLGSDLALGGNENECRMRRIVVARMIANPELSFASFSSLASIIVKQGLFKPSPSASVEEWVASVKSAWQGELDEAGIAELTKDLGAKLSPKTQSAGRPTPEPRGSAGAGQGRYKRKISPAELQQILDLHQEYLRDTSTGERANLSGATLKGANLYRADLTHAYLMDTNLTNADLLGADLRLADLTRANLSGANFEDARLMNADLRYAYLGGADFRGANLSGAHLSGAHLSGADLWLADLSGATYDSKTIFPHGFDPVEQDMILVN